MNIHSHTTIGINNERVLDKPVFRRGVTIPAGFMWDGASVPRVFWFIMPKFGENSVAFLMHDFLYSRYAPHSLSRLEADQILREDLIQLGVGKVRAALVYRTVRLFGGSHFRS
jgi:hypothetical protein